MLVNKQPPASFSTRKYIDRGKLDALDNVINPLPTQLVDIPENKTSKNNAVSVKPTVDLYKTLDPAVVPDIPASYINQPDRTFDRLVKRDDLFHQYNERQKNLQDQVGLYTEKLLQDELHRNSLDPYFYQTRQQTADSELNSLLNKSRPLNTTEITALENRILGQDPQLLPDINALSHIVNNAQILNFIQSRVNFTTAPKGSWTDQFRVVLVNTFVRLRMMVPSWLGPTPTVAQAPVEYSAPARRQTEDGIVQDSPMQQRTFVPTSAPTGAPTGAPISAPTSVASSVADDMIRYLTTGEGRNLSVSAKAAQLALLGDESQKEVLDALPLMTRRLIEQELKKKP